jgi:hypothetical protein
MIGHYLLHRLAGPPNPIAGRRWIKAAAASGGREPEAALAPSGEALFSTPAAGRSEESRPSTLET